MPGRPSSAFLQNGEASTCMRTEASQLSSIGAEIAAFYGGAQPAASTLIGVQTLALPEFLSEIEAKDAPDESQLVRIS
jgi:hypothetical protein